MSWGGRTLHLSLVLSQRLWRQREVHDGEEGPDDKVERRDQGKAEKHSVRVRVGAQVCDDGVPCRLQQSHHGDGGEEGEGYVLEHAAANANNSFAQLLISHPLRYLIFWSFANFMPIARTYVYFKVYIKMS